jgi:hypothetical protein
LHRLALTAAFAFKASLIDAGCAGHDAGKHHLISALRARRTLDGYRFELTMGGLRHDGFPSCCRRERNALRRRCLTQDVGRRWG